MQNQVSMIEVQSSLTKWGPIHAVVWADTKIWDRSGPYISIYPLFTILSPNRARLIYP